MTIVSYFLATTDHPIDQNHLLWNRPLPQTRLAGTPPVQSLNGEAVTYGSYFSAVLRFCAADGWNRVLRAAARKLGQPVAAKDLGDLSIYLEKHGAFYHPARLRVWVKDQPLSLVINVAISEPGRQAQPREVKALEKLNNQRPFGWFPRVYDAGAAGLPMFLADWFEGFHEFHLTRQTDREEPAVAVWDGAVERRLLSPTQTADLYRHAAMILTACYDPIKACQIFPWHHAAGDFVVRLADERVSVKLISVRDYAPMSGSAGKPDSEQKLLDALVVFFIHLTLRMRLDRLDGVADVVWAPASCLAPIVDGFFQGLDLTARISGFPEAFPDIVSHYINRIEAADLLAMARRISATVYDAHADERRVIDANLTGHVRGLCQLLSIR